MSNFLEELSVPLREKVLQVIAEVPDSKSVFEEVYFSRQVSEDANISSKKRKFLALDVATVSNENVVFELQDVSVLSPLRKKLTMTISLDEQNQTPMISFNKNNNVEYVIDNIKESVKFSTFLPFPEKKNLMYFFMCYEREEPNSDPVLITLNKEQILKQFIERNLISETDNDFQFCVDYMRRQAILTGFRISDPFSKSVMESHHSFFVDCHRGSKEGSLFFLPENIIFGFKKPILLFESKQIDAITYSSITRLTFNVTLITKDGEKFEFSMIDQNKFSEIDEYVKRKQVEDKSMSDELKAKTPKSGQASDQSVLKEALEESGSLDKLNGDSDDDDDENFEEESDLSDGSGSEDSDNDEDSDDDFGEQSNDQNGGGGEEEEEEEEEGEEDEDEEQEEEAGRDKDETANKAQYTADGTPSNQFSMEIDEIPDLLNENGLIQDIPITMDDDDDDDEDEEGSGVEYD
ncbi:unnamed protein product [Kluyveromyces dobzhanskii CBS 2104]|uniref:Histone chaperone RTT106 n=1 Tax=Kluyveromyces dobzhanskii CBS 2104 TaxID=1427455 RepID=A0A0A8L751_9SACH|nr:unnamed protein product [Kluyveromyces dobzhanskii CBS 2104]